MCQIWIAGWCRYTDRKFDFWCAVQRRGVSAGATPARQADTFQPEGIGAASGGNDTAEASGVEGPLRDLPRVQAVIPINVIEASKRIMREPTRPKYGEGCQSVRPKPGYGRTLWGQDTRRGKDDGMYTKEHQRNTGDPMRSGCVSPNRQAARPRPGRMGSRIGPWYR